MSLAILFHFLFAQHVSDINISIIRSLRLFCWITTLVVLFLIRCVLEFRYGWVGVVSVLQASACNIPNQPHRNSNTHRTKNNMINVVIQQSSRKLLVMDILMSETCWAYKKWNKISSDIKLVFFLRLFLVYLFLVYLSTPTYFRWICAHHHDKQLCLWDTWYLLFCTDDCLLCRVEFHPAYQTVMGTYSPETCKDY